MKKSILLFLFLTVTSSCTRYSGVVKQDTSFPLEEAFTLSLNESIQTLAISDSWVVVQTPGKLTALDMATKDMLWTLDNFSTDVDSQFIITDDIFTAVSYERILVINRAGEKKKVDLDPNGGDITQLISAYDNYLYVIRGPSWVLEVYDIIQNTLLWETPVGRGQTNAFYDSQSGITYIVTPNSVNAYENSSGELLWNEQANTIQSYFDKGVLYLCQKLDDSGALSFSALDVNNRKELWTKEYPFGAEIYRLSIIENMLVVTTRYNFLAIDRNDGDQLWLSETADDIFFNDPVEYNNVLYARGSSGKLYAIAVTDGRIIGTLYPEENPRFPSRYEAGQKVYRLNYGIAISKDKQIVVFESK